MKINKWLFICMLCFSGAGLPAISDELSRLIQKFSDDLDDEEGLSYTTSLELGKDKIREISLFYSGKKSLDVSQARVLIIKVVNEFLDDVNANHYLKSDLYEHPFPEDRLDITIFFRGKDGKYAKSPKVAQVSFHKGIVSFYKYSQGSFQVIHQENYQRASKVAASGSSSCHSLLDKFYEGASGLGLPLKVHHH